MINLIEMIKLIWTANINWHALSAIGTMAAVFVSLWLALRQERRNIKIIIASSPRYSDKKSAQIVLVNQGNKVETIMRMLYRDKESNKISEYNSYYNNGVKLVFPVMIPAHGYISFDSPYLENDENKVKDIIIEDAFGKKWYSNRKNFNFARDLLSRYRGSYGAMFDKDKSE